MEVGGRQCLVAEAGVARPLLLHKVGSEVGRNVLLAGTGAGRGHATGKTEPDMGLAPVPWSGQ